MGKIPLRPRFTWRSIPKNPGVFGVVPYTLDELTLRMNAPDAPTPEFGSGRSPTPAEIRAEKPGPDGIRHGLVAHIRKMIASGAYDSPERWAVAEELLFQRVLER